MQDLSFIHTGKDISYTDLPSLEFFSQYEATRDNKGFLAALRVYHSIDRTDLSSIDSRLLLLNHLNSQLHGSNVFTKHIKETIEKKAHHLRELKKLFEKGILRDEPEMYNKEIEKAFKSTQLGHLHIKNCCVYDFENNVMLGNYILEAVDPAHRFNLTSYLDKWKGSCSKIPFFLYLEQNCNYDLIPQVHYLSDDELETKRLTFQDGKLCFEGKPITTNPKEEFLFVQDLDGNLYGTVASKRMKHTSLSRARPVSAAGSIEAKKGEITQIGLDSGHYFPSLNTIYTFLSLLRANDITVKDDTRVLYHNNFQKYYTSVKEIERC